MKYKLSVAAVLLPLLVACGGGGDDSGDDGNTNTGNGNGNGGVVEDRTRPAAGTQIVSSLSGEAIVVNGSTGSQDAPAGPLTNRLGSDGNFPRLAVGDFWWVNNAFQSSLTSYSDWFQTITIEGSQPNHTVRVVYDWGTETDRGESRFSTVSFPELIYGVKSEGEKSGTFADTGLPIENSKLPTSIQIDYDYSYEEVASQSTTTNPAGTLPNDGFNVAIESFWHDSCNIIRTGNINTDNQNFEMMVWLHIGKRGPSAERLGGQVATVTVGGREWAVFTKLNAFGRQSEANVRNYLAFVATEENFTGSIPYHEFIEIARTRLSEFGTGWRELQDTDCFANILMGSEIWFGAGSFEWKDVTITQTY